MLISLSLDLLSDLTVVGRDQIELADGLRFRVTGWDTKHRRLLLEPITSATGSSSMDNAPDGCA